MEQECWSQKGRRSDRVRGEEQGRVNGVRREEGREKKRKAGRQGGRTWQAGN